MEQQGFLIGFAQLALVLTGFVSIFVVFQIDHQSKSRVTTQHLFYSGVWLPLSAR